MPDNIPDPWKVIRKGHTPDGHPIEMRHAVFGKGKAKIVKWEFFRDGENVGYAVNMPDAEQNWQRVAAGFVLNTSTGNYEHPQTGTRSYVTVTCPDGQKRHDAPFATRAEADKFAEWGHGCLAAADHKIEEVWA